MRAIVFSGPGKPLSEARLPDPKPASGQVLLKVRACGVCRTDLHLLDGELPDPKIPVVPGHQIVGEVLEAPGAEFAAGERVGVPWLGSSCGKCEYCRSGKENLCPDARHTGYQIDGGFAQMCVAEAGFCFRIPAGYPDEQAAPLLCAGLIGYRALRMAGEARRLGFYGFGSAAHILTQLALYEGKTVFAFTRPGDAATQEFARSLGASWAGASGERPPERLDAALIFAPDGALVPAALREVIPGGVVICAGIHMSDIPSFPYSLLWMERSIKSVANLTRRDGEEFLAIAPRVPIRTKVKAYPLERAQEALEDLRRGRFEGAAVVLPGFGA